MKETFRLVCMDFLLVVFGVLLGTGVAHILDGVEGVAYPWYYPFQIIGTGVLGSVPSLLFYFKNEPTRKQFLIRLGIHFVLLCGAIMGLGAMWKWYTSWQGAIIVFVIFILVYFFVWFGSKMMDRKTASNINDALKRYQEGNVKKDK